MDRDLTALLMQELKYVVEKPDPEALARWFQVGHSNWYIVRIGGGELMVLTSRPLR